MPAIRNRLQAPIDYSQEVGVIRAEQIVLSKKRLHSSTNTLRCWLYTGSVNTDGYGQVWTKPNSMFNHKGRRAQKAFLLHILAFISAGNCYDSTLQVSHLCNNRSCFNPAHLIQESAAVNNSRKNCEGPNIIVALPRVTRSNCAHEPPCIREYVFRLGEKARPFYSSQ